MNQIKLGELFTSEQLDRICALCDEHKDDSLALVKALKQYFATFAEELEGKGVLPDYAAYAVTASLPGFLAHQGFRKNGNE